METLLRRWIWLLDAAVIAIAAIAMADATARLLSRVEIQGLPRQLIEEYVASEEPTPAKKIDAILQRNIFSLDRMEYVPEIDSLRPSSLALRLVAIKVHLASHISLAADRAGQRINIEYDIR